MDSLIKFSSLIRPELYTLHVDQLFEIIKYFFETAGLKGNLLAKITF